jgi:RHS repeat-associated protein
MSLTYGYTPGLSGAFGAGTTNANAGQVVSISGSISGTTQNQVFTYDNVSRLVTATQSGSWARRYAYDRWSNRTGAWDATSGGTQIQSFVHQQSGGYPTNRITSVTNTGVTTPYTYDNSGNVTNDGNAYAYDADHRLASTTGTSTGTYFYSERRLRVKKVVAGITSYAVWEGNHVLSEHSGAGAVLVDYVYRDERLIGKVDATGLLYCHADRLSIRMLTTTSGSVAGTQSHMPFGDAVSGTGIADTRRFTKYNRDAETGTDYALHRQYSNGIGDFLQPDPDPAACKVSPNFNRYAYSSNDPINRVDPSGLDDEPPYAGQPCAGGGIRVWVQVATDPNYGYWDCVLVNGEGRPENPIGGGEPVVGGGGGVGGSRYTMKQCMQDCLTKDPDTLTARRKNMEAFNYNLQIAWEIRRRDYDGCKTIQDRAIRRECFKKARDRYRDRAADAQKLFDSLESALYIKCNAKCQRFFRASGPTYVAVNSGTVQLPGG